MRPKEVSQAEEQGWHMCACVCVCACTRVCVARKGNIPGSRKRSGVKNPEAAQTLMLFKDLRGKPGSVLTEKNIQCRKTASSISGAGKTGQLHVK